MPLEVLTTILLLDIVLAETAIPELTNQSHSSDIYQAYVQGVNMTIDEIKSIITPLVTLYPINRVILFGSHARGDATECSDVDLIIDSEGRLNTLDYFGIIGMIVKKMPIKVDVFELDEVKRPSSMFDSISKRGSGYI